MRERSLMSVARAGAAAAVEEQRANETEAPTLPPAGGVGPLVALLQCAVRAGVHPRQYGGVLAEAAAAREHALLLEAIGHGGVASAGVRMAICIPVCAPHATY